MVWQDLTIAVVNLFLSYALVPQIIKNYKEKRGNVDMQTSIISFSALYVLSYTVYTLELYFSTITTATAATLWLVIFTQRLLYR